MSGCRGCEQEKTLCTCHFQDSSNALVTGNGREYAPINYRPTNVPLPRPYGDARRCCDDQILPANSETPLVFDSIDETPFAGGMVDPATFRGDPFTPEHLSTKLTVPVGGHGIYLINGFASINQPGVVLAIRKNGSERLATQTSGADKGGFFGSIVRSVFTVADLVDGDFIELVGITGGSSATVIGSDFNTFFFSGPIFQAQWMRS